MGLSGYYPVIIRSSFSPDRYPVDYYPILSGKTVSGTSLISHIFFSEIKHHSATCWERGVTNC